jgi:hypothetical protein
MGLSGQGDFGLPEIGVWWLVRYKRIGDLPRTRWLVHFHEENG